MQTTSKKALAMGLSVLFLAGCGNKIKIVTPEEGAIYSYDSASSEVLITYKDIDTSTLALTLNGVDISSSFTITDTQATTTLAALQPLLVDGANTLSVTAPEEHARKFQWDISGPVVHITEYDAINENTAQITGYLQDSSAVASLTINGSNVAFDEDNQFSFQFDPATLSSATFEAIDSYGFSRTTEFRVSDSMAMSFGGSPLYTDIGARVNSSGIDFVESEILDLIQDIDLEAVVLAENPLVYESKDLKQCIPIIGCVSLGTAWIRVKAEWLNVGNIGLNVAPRNGQNIIDANVTVDNISIGLDPDAHTPGIDYGLFDVTVNMSNVTANSALQITPASNGGVNATMQSININLDVDLGPLESALNTIDDILDIFGLGGLTNTVKGAINGAVEGELESQLSSLLPPKLAEFSQLIPTNGSFDLLGKSFTVAGKALSFSGNNGGLTATVGIAPYASNPEQFAFGNRYQASSMPSLNFTTTPGGNSFQVGAMVSSNTMNRALLAAHEAGMTHLDDVIYEGTALSEILGDKIEGDDQIKLAVEPLSPGWVTLNDTGSALATMHIQDFKLNISLKKPADADFSPLLTATVNASVPVTIGIGQNSDLDVAIEDLPTVTVSEMTILGLDLGNALGTTLVDWLMPQLLPSLAEGITSIPLPTVEGYGFAPVEFWYANEAHLGIAGNMTSANTIASARIAVSAANDNNWNVASVLGGDTQYTSGEQLRFDIESGADAAVQVRYRLDSAEWSTWQVRDAINLYRVLSGEHSLNICSRDETLAAGNCETLTFSVSGD